MRFLLKSEVCYKVAKINLILVKGIIGKIGVVFAGVTLASSCALVSDEQTRSTPSSPLVDDSVCGVVSTDTLEDVLGFRTSWYRYHTFYNYVAGQEEPDGSVYDCYMDSAGSPYGLMEINYRLGDDVNAFPVQKSDASEVLDFDDVPHAHPDSVKAISFDDIEGEGWMWIDGGVNIYTAWRYPNGYMMVARLTSWTDPGPTEEQMQGYQALAEQIIPRIPEVASEVPVSVKVSPSNAT